MPLDPSPRSYAEARHWAEQFDTDLSLILGLELYRHGSFADDVKRGIDSTVKELRVAERIRNITRYASYKRQVTLRYSRPTGAVTEYQKLREGTMQADIVFYGWGEAHSRTIKAYVILLVPPLRAWLNGPGKTMGTISRNDDDTELIAFNIRALPREVVYAWKRLPDPRQLDLFTQRYTHAVIVR